MFCGSQLTELDFCTVCGEDVRLYKKIVYISNACYNDGLAKARVRDLSGAVVSLKKSLKFNKRNIQARNLLGLVYFATGEMVEALTQWIISKNIQSDKNVAGRYIKELQSNQSRLDSLNQTIKKFNQALFYCRQGSEDMAIIQLKKILNMNPNLLKGHQLLALLYIREEEFEKARQCLKKAIKIDAANTITLRYFRELDAVREKAAEPAKKKSKKKDQVSYTNGNETIIQPASVKDNTGIMTVVNILIGLAVGAALMWFLVMPARMQSVKNSSNKEIVQYSDQIAAKDSEINSMKKQVEDAKAEAKKAKNSAKDVSGTVTSYENFVKAVTSYEAGGYDESELASTLQGIDVSDLSEDAKSLYETMTGTVYEKACRTLYNNGRSDLRSGRYDDAIDKLGQVVKMIEDYRNGDAMYCLAESYEKKGDLDNAKKTYEKVVELVPNTYRARNAQRFIDEGYQKAKDEQQGNNNGQ